MGGRGSASGNPYKLGETTLTYGDEYESILAIDNIKFVKYKLSKSAKTPLETMSAMKDRDYVLVNIQNQLKSIHFYNKSGKLRRQIDLLVPHKGKLPHIHIGYLHSEDTVEFTKKDKAYVNKVKQIWKEFNDAK
jgi:hypothetical protein